MQQRVSDFIADFFVKNEMLHVFLLTGGGAMHLNDAFGRHHKLHKIYNHHEQASSMAAESYARLTTKIPIVNVTTGPGGINALNGVFGAWVDSLPMFVISGQVRRETMLARTSLPLRQLGDQECPIVEVVKKMTKYAKVITDVNLLLYHLEKALYLAKTGRPGPVWIDVPMDIQGAYIDPSKLIQYNPNNDKINHAAPPPISEKQVECVLEKLSQAKRPVILVGAGVRISGAHEDFLKLIDYLAIPVTTAWNAHDTLYDEHPYHAGKPGTIGDRYGNFAVQNADVLLILGSRLNIRQISYNWQSFARSAYKIMVDADLAELMKPTLTIDLAIHGNLAEFIPKLLHIAKNFSIPSKSDWIQWCQIRKKKYPVVLEEYFAITQNVNPYCFMQRLSEHLQEGQIIVTGDGTACVTSFQAMKIKPKQRLYTNSGCASMGYDLPGAIGACVGSNGQPIICLAGDGSIMQNIQELATISFNQYPIKIFLLNNNGYHSIRQTQQNFFGEPLIGVGPDSGLGFPSFEKIAEAFNIPFVRCHNHPEMDVCITKVLANNGPIICEVMLDLMQQFSPKLSSRRLEDGTLVTGQLEDMAPFLTPEELAENMIDTKTEDR